MNIRLKYALIFIGLLSLECAIALHVHDHIIRPFVGDLLIVVMLYCFLQMIVNGRPAVVALIVFLFACLIELLQLVNFIEALRLEDSYWAKIVLGSTFDPLDLLVYLAGSWLSLIVEFRALNKKA